jgi:hypothetical protein
MYRCLVLKSAAAPFDDVAQQAMQGVVWLEGCIA